MISIGLVGRCATDVVDQWFSAVDQTVESMSSAAGGASKASASTRTSNGAARGGHGQRQKRTALTFEEKVGQIE